MAENMIASDYEYLEEVNQNLLCPICFCAFVRPVSSPCGHTFCQSCITSAFSSSPTSTCPIDRSPLAFSELSPVVKLVQNLLDELSVYCNHHKGGCKWTGQRQGLQTHLDVHCAYVESECCNEGCNKSVLRKDIEHHAQVCEWRAQTCPGCHAAVQRRDAEKHSKECPAGNTACPHCHAELARAELITHTDECPELLIACRQSHHGCPWQGPRKTESEHIPSCAFEALKSFFVLYDKRYDESRLENHQLRTQLMELQQQVAEFRNREVAGTLSPLSDHAASLLVQDTADHVEQLTADTDRLRGEVRDISAEMYEMERRHEMALLGEAARLRDELHSLHLSYATLQRQMVAVMVQGQKDSAKGGGSSSTGDNSVLSTALGALAATSRPRPSSSASESQSINKDSDRSRRSATDYRQDGATKL
ncbi:hypothetical protein DFS34DRAFT_602880 [Phlyctochytrium arcticum]|nr:hypothetical protein DFS34DRAFT_602880 [Phlyctochytrium arcticum]